MNNRFAKLAADHTPTYAPDVVTIGSQTYLHPTASEYAYAPDGPYWPCIDEPPSEPAPEGYHYELTGWDERVEKEKPYAATIRSVYSLVADPPPPPRTFSKLKCVAALINAGVWDDAKGYIEQLGLYDLFLAAQDFAEDNEYFEQGKAALQESLGMTDEQVEDILAASVAEEGR